MNTIYTVEQYIYIIIGNMDEHKRNIQLFVVYAPCTWEECPVTADLLLLQEREVHFLCTDLFHLEVVSDNPDSHPSKFSKLCCLAMQCMIKYLVEEVYRTSLVAHV